MMQPGVRDLLKQRMNKRTLAAILGVKDRELDQYLPEAVSEHFRWIVLSECNAFLELVLDVIDSLDDGSCTVNEIWLEELAAKVDAIHRAAVPPEVVPTSVGATNGAHG